VSIVLKSGRHSLLEPSGPVQACNRTALPLQCSEHVDMDTIWYAENRETKLTAYYNVHHLRFCGQYMRTKGHMQVLRANITQERVASKISKLNPSKRAPGTIGLNSTEKFK
jgi:hypothetical protein